MITETLPSRTTTRLLSVKVSKKKISADSFGMKRFLSFLLSVPLFLLPQHARSQDQTIPQLVKWCNDTGSIRYTTPNIRPEGFQKCENQLSPAYCDAEGKKFFGPKEQAPYGYLDCSRGPRIEIIRHDPLPAPLTRDDYREEEYVEPLAPRTPRKNEWTHNRSVDEGTEATQRLLSQQRNILRENDDPAVTPDAVQQEMQRLIKKHGGIPQAIIGGYKDYFQQLDQLLEVE